MSLFRFIILTGLVFPSISWSLCVTASQANLRAKPSVNSKKLWTVGKYMPFIELDYKGGWYFVKDLEGKKMWIASGLVTDKIDCAVIKVSQSILRKGPGTEFGKTALTVGHKYLPFKKLQREDAWLYLQDDYGFKHWIYEKNLWEPLEYTSLTY